MTTYQGQAVLHHHLRELLQIHVKDAGLWEHQ
jgi:hypothetical protein